MVTFSNIHKLESLNLYASKKEGNKEGRKEKRQERRKERKEEWKLQVEEGALGHRISRILQKMYMKLSCC